MAIDPGARIVQQEEIVLEKESRARKNFIRKIIAEISTPSVYTVIRYLDYQQRFKSYFHKNKVYEFKDYQQGQMVALIAIWEYDYIRRDIKNLIDELNARNFYVCVINTGKIDSELFEHLASIYIQRFNYGRDFGSYKEGFLYLSKKGILSLSPKLLMVNDSVFFLRQSISQALDSFVQSEKKVLGATENFDIWHHLGSFFIMFDKKILQSRKFLHFWKRFKKSDIRTKNIRYGEIKLTDVVKKIVPEEQTAAYWSLSALSEKIDTETALSSAISLSNRGHLTGWKKLSWQMVTKMFLQERLVAINDFQTSPNLKFTSENGKRSEYDSLRAIHDYDSSIKLIEEFSNQELNSDIFSDLFLKSKGLFITTAASGSQIHQNGNLLVTLGCPLVKLDLIYRGAYSYEDSELLFTLITDIDDRNLVREIIYRRAFGIEALRGWKRSAFGKGLI